MGEIVGPVIGGTITDLYNFEVACISVSILNLLFGALFLFINYKFIANFYYGNEVERQLNYVEESEYHCLRNISLRNISKTGGVLGSLKDQEFEISLIYVSKKRRAKIHRKSIRDYNALKDSKDGFISN